ncbi:MAG: DUF1343 domain-containing protein [Anaerolineaceae bacterium]|nr:DUF1343 domain-containing protein [Anaerolineaceae bacterium]
MKPRTQQVRTGIEVLRDSNFAELHGKRVGLFTNPSAVDGKLISTYDILRREHTINLTALFSPEHGLTAAAADGEQIATITDTRTGLPIYSLYGTSERPTPEMLSHIDAIVCDIQDIGVRYYTFIWTISHILEAAGDHGVEVIVLDRPNPLGNRVEGASLDAHLASLVGRYPIPTQYGMTLGELAFFLNSIWNPNPAPLTIVPCEGHRRETKWRDTGLPFVPPSPNMPHLTTAQHYPGACLVEGTSLSEGRGTALPFEIVGAPEIDGTALAQVLNRAQWPGVRFRPHVFKPITGKHAGSVCGGVQVHIVDEESYQPLKVWLEMLRIIYLEFSFTWNNHFSRLIGSHDVQTAIENGKSLDAFFANWEVFCNAFHEQRRPFLIYD